MAATQKQIAYFRVLLVKGGFDEEDKKQIVLNFTANRTVHFSECTQVEINKIISSLTAINDIFPEMRDERWEV